MCPEVVRPDVDKWETPPDRPIVPARYNKNAPLSVGEPFSIKRSPVIPAALKGGRSIRNLEAELRPAA